MIKVSNDVTIYERDGNDVTGCPSPTIIVRSHWVRNTLVVLEIDGKSVTVAVADLAAAISNATNSARHG